jgi:hypothetical protein
MEGSIWTKVASAKPWGRRTRTSWSVWRARESGEPDEASDGDAQGGVRAFVTIPFTTAAAELVESGDANGGTVSVVAAIVFALALGALMDSASWPNRGGSFLSSRAPGHELMNDDRTGLRPVTREDGEDKQGHRWSWPWMVRRVRRRAGVALTGATGAQQTWPRSRVAE